MTTVCVLCDPPSGERVLADLVSTSPLDESDARALYVALLRDVCLGVEASGGDLLVNYREAGEDAEERVRDVVEPVLAEPEEARFEVQVGETFAGRAGNSVSHLLEQEAVETAAVVTPHAAFLSRPVVDSAAMKLRSSSVVLGPTTDGRVYYSGFAEPIDFADAYAPPSIETVTNRALDAGLDVDFLPMLPVVEGDGDLVDLVATIRARSAAGRIVPEHTAAFVAERGLTVVSEGDELVVVR